MPASRRESEKERVPPVAEREREPAEDGEDEVEDREDVRPDDARVRPARRSGRDVSTIETAALGFVAAQARAVRNAHNVTAPRESAGRDIKPARH